MCGFAGYAGMKEYDASVIRKMTDKIRHRGPDSQDAFVEGGVGLGFVRLSIIDLEGGSQPMFNEDKNLVLIFNGELYNYQGIREELIQAGHVFTTHTDSEILLHGYEEWGKEGLLKKLRGMFAFVIFDRKKKTLFGARGPFRHQAVLLLPIRTVRSCLAPRSSLSWLTRISRKSCSRRNFRTS